MSAKVSAVLVVEGEPAQFALAHGGFLIPPGTVHAWGSVTWRPLPLALMQGGMRPEHVVGIVDKIDRVHPAEGISWVKATMRIENTDLVDAARMRPLGVVFHGGDIQGVQGLAAADGEPSWTIDQITILGATIVPLDQAPWPECRLEIVG